MSAKVKLNLGCGDRTLAHWTNVDMSSRPPTVLGHDLTEPLPFAAESFDVVYHSHVLEHMDREHARQLLHECHRVLRPGGILRVVVPDLEDKARCYLQALDAAAREPSDTRLSDLDWTVVELIDQMVRSRSGGEMVAALRRAAPDSLAARRIGDEFERARAHPQPNRAESVPASFRERLRRRLRGFLGISDSEWEWLQFRRRGESHLWMYDKVSLAALLKDVGFAETTVTSADSSRIPDWLANDSWLDLENGIPRKPDSLYMEAGKA